MPATLTPPAPTVEMVLALPERDREAIFIALLKQLTEVQGDYGLIPIATESESLGYYVPPAAAAAIAQARGPDLTREEEAEFRRRLAIPGEVTTAAEAVTALKAEADARRRIPA